MIRAAVTCAAALVLGAGLGGCKGEKFVEAARDFVDFGKGSDRVMDPNSAKKAKYEVRSWKEEIVNGRQRAVADIQVDFRISPEDLETVLRDAVHDDLVQRGSAAIMVRAWPGKLARIAAPMGIGIFARDGHGWDGTGVGFEQLHVLIPPAAQARSRNIQQLSEREYLMVLGVENIMRKGADLEAAQRQTAEFQGVSIDEVQKACLRSAKMAQWLRARAEAVLHPVSQ